MAKATATTGSDGQVLHTRTTSDSTSRRCSCSARTAAIRVLDPSTLATQTTLAAVFAKLIASPATEATLATLGTQTTSAAILAKLSADPATQTTLAAVLAALGGTLATRKVPLTSASVAQVLVERHCGDVAGVERVSQVADRLQRLHGGPVREVRVGRVVFELHGEDGGGGLLGDAAPGVHGHRDRRVGVGERLGARDRGRLMPLHSPPSAQSGSGGGLLAVTAGGNQSGTYAPAVAAARELHRLRSPATSPWRQRGGRRALKS
jgi:hypothetical protein